MLSFCITYTHASIKVCACPPYLLMHTYVRVISQIDNRRVSVSGSSSQELYSCHIDMRFATRSCSLTATLSRRTYVILPFSSFFLHNFLLLCYRRERMDDYRGKYEQFSMQQKYSSNITVIVVSKQANHVLLISNNTNFQQPF